MRSLILSLIAAFISSSAPAHEGHSHGPSGPEAVNGGVVKEGKSLNMELVSQSGEVKLFPAAKDGKPLSVESVELSATAQPRGKPKAKITLQPSGTHFLGKIDAKGSKRLELKVEASLKGSKAKDAFVFQVEPEG